MAPDIGPTAIHDYKSVWLRLVHHMRLKVLQVDDNIVGGPPPPVAADHRPRSSPLPCEHRSKAYANAFAWRWVMSV